MGNNVSVPPREPYVNQQTSYNTMLQNVNQSRLVGNPDPLTQNNDPGAKAILKTASPRGFDLTQTLSANHSQWDARAEECRSYTGMAGLRDLALKTGSRTAYEPGCGWIYKNNFKSRGAFGSEGDPSSPNNTRAPIFSRAGEVDELTNGASFSMDLGKIERIISEDMVNGITTCQGMAGKGIDVAPYIGFCQTSRRVIPVQRKAAGGADARFQDDVQYRCASDQIILPENISNCPASETVNQTSNSIGNQGFKNYESVQTRGRNIDKAFYQPNWALNNQRAAMPQMLSNRGGFAAGAERQGQGTNFGGSQQFSPSSFARHEGFATGDSPLLSPSFGNRRSEGFAAGAERQGRGMSAREGFAAGAERQRQGGSQQFSPNGGFARHEGFTNTFINCKISGNLTNTNGSKDCIIEAAHQAGFGENGAFLKFARAGLNSTMPPIFNTYKLLKTNTAFEPSTFTNGTKSINDIINILTLVRLDISNSNDEISKAATDIVSDAGTYDANYNLCNWIVNPEVDGNLIISGDTTTEKCLQNYWRNRGGDSRGIQFPTLGDWVGQTIGIFKQSFELIASDINSTNIDTQSTAIKNQYGVNTYKEKEIVKYIDQPRRDCEREFVSSTEASCPNIISMGQTMPKYNEIYRVKSGKDAVAGGQACRLEEQKDCNSRKCDPIDCLGAWTENGLGCSTQCGAGTKTQNYVISRHADCDGAQCEAAAGDVRSVDCNAGDCAPTACVYTANLDRACPTDLTHPDKCGKPFTNKITYTRTNTSGNSTLCPPYVVENSCGAVVACPPPSDNTIMDDTQYVDTTPAANEVLLYYGTNYTNTTIHPTPVRLSKLGVISPSDKGENIKSIRIGSGVKVKVIGGPPHFQILKRTLCFDISRFTLTPSENYTEQMASENYSEQMALSKRVFGDSYSCDTSAAVTGFPPVTGYTPPAPTEPAPIIPASNEVLLYYGENYTNTTKNPNPIRVQINTSYTGVYDSTTKQIERNNESERVRSIRIGSGVKVDIKKVINVIRSFCVDTPKFDLYIGKGVPANMYLVEKVPGDSCGTPAAVTVPASIAPIVPVLNPVTLAPCEVILYYGKNFTNTQSRPNPVRFSIDDAAGSFIGGYIDEVKFIKKADINSIRSIRVGSGVTVKIYGNTPVSGKTPVMDILTDTGDLGNFDMKMKSLQLFRKAGSDCGLMAPCVIIFYSKINYEGEFVVFSSLNGSNVINTISIISEDEYRARVKFPVKSIRIGSGVELRVWGIKDNVWKSKSIQNNTPNLETNFTINLMDITPKSGSGCVPAAQVAGYVPPPQGVDGIYAPGMYSSSTYLAMAEAERIRIENANR